MALRKFIIERDIPALAAGDAMARARAADLEGDDLLARPPN